MQLVLPHILQSEHIPYPLHNPPYEGGYQDDSPPTQTMLVPKTCVYKDDTGNVCNATFEFDVSPLLTDSLAWCDGCRAKASARRKKNLRRRKTQSPYSRITEYLYAQLRQDRSRLGHAGTDLGKTNTSTPLDHIDNTQKKVRWMDEVDPRSLAFPLQNVHSPDRPRIDLPQARPTRPHESPTTVVLQKMAHLIWTMSYLGLGHFLWKIFVYYTRGLSATDFPKPNL